MTQEEIIKRAYKLARSQVASSEYARDIQEIGVLMSDALYVIDLRFRTRWLFNSLSLLNKETTSSAYADTTRYRYALSTAFKQIGAREQIEPIAITHYSNARYIIENHTFEIFGFPNGETKIGINHQMMSVKAQPLLVAKMVDEVMKQESPQPLVDEILKESYSLLKMEDICSITAHQLTDDMLSEVGLKLNLSLCSHKRIRIRVYDDSMGFQSSFLTSMDKLVDQVKKRTARYKKKSAISQTI